jgi:hypothetical protein
MCSFVVQALLGSTRVVVPCDADAVGEAVLEGAEMLNALTAYGPINVNAALKDVSVAHPAKVIESPDLKKWLEAVTTLAVGPTAVMLIVAEVPVPPVVEEVDTV